jgi:hypothetical protein
MLPIASATRKQVHPPSAKPLGAPRTATAGPASKAVAIGLRPSAQDIG